MSETTKTEEPKKDAITTVAGSLAVPPALEVEETGLEHYGKQDIKMPRLALAQKQSPEIEEGNAAFIPNLKEGMMFNKLTREIYGKGPLELMIVRGDPPRWIEFNPREQGGGIKDMNVRPGDPRTEFKDGKPPIATQFYDFVAVLLPSRELVALSFKSTAIKVAQSLIALMKIRNRPLYEGKYTLMTVPDKNTKGSFWNYKIQNSAIIDDDTDPNRSNPKGEKVGGWVNDELKEYGRQLFQGLKGKKLDIDREEDKEEDTSFDTAKFEDSTSRM